MKWIQTYMGKKFYPFDPKILDICIEDIAHSLSLICRFNGHCTEFYSVAQHSCLVSGLAAEEAKHWGLLAELDAARTGLMHDAAEAYLGDIVTPIKSDEDKSRETALNNMIVLSFGWMTSKMLNDIVNKADALALSYEKVVLMKHFIPWPGVVNCDQMSVKIFPMSPKEAEKAFLERFNILSKGTVVK